MNAPLARRPTRDLAQAAVAGLGGLKHPMISRAGNRFTLVDIAGSQKPIDMLYIDVVIVDIGPNDSRMYFAGQYDPANAGNGEPPTCFSDNGKGPSTLSRVPQHPTCTGCPQSVWGSKITQQGNQVPACQSGKKLAVIVLNPPAGADPSTVYEFRVPPGSFNHKPAQDPQAGGWTWYCNAIAGYKYAPCDVVTRISFVPGTMGVLSFKPVALVGGTLAEPLLYAAWDKPDLHLEIVGDKDVAIDPASFQQRLAPPAQQQPAAPPPPPQPFPQPTQQVQYQPPQPQVAQPAPAPVFPQPGQGAPAPFAPPTAPPAGQFQAPTGSGTFQPAGAIFPPGQPQSGPATTASPTDKPKRPRRTKEQIAADNAAAAAAQSLPVPGVFAPQPAQQAIGTVEVLPPQAAGGPPVSTPFAPFAPQPVGGDIPGFLQRAPEAAPQPAPSFGMEAPQGVDAAMTLNLDAVFGAPPK